MTTATYTGAPDKLRALHTQLETAFADLVSSDEWARMLAAAARFHSYSPANVLLIARQRPDARRVAGYRTCRPANGRTDYTARTVTIRADVADAQAAKTLAHELAHVHLHDGAAYALGCRGLIEVEAESVTYIVATAVGLASDAYTLPYVAHWSGGNLNAIKVTAERVIACAHGILSTIETSEAHTNPAVIA